MLHAALEIESDAFWTSITTSGFKTVIARYAKASKSLTTSHSWLERFPAADNVHLADTFQAIIRAIKWNKLHVKQQNKYSSDGSDQE